MLTIRLLFMTTSFFVLSLVLSKEKPKTKKELDLEKDRQFLISSIAKFGPPRSHKLYDLPGPEILTDFDEKIQNIFIHRGDNVTYKYRSNAKEFSYNEFFENIQTQMNDGEKMLIIKGQITEKRPRTFGTYYLRTVGYTYDNNGFRMFLIDVSKVETKEKEVSIQPRIGITSFNNMPGSSPKSKSRISSSILASLAGGGLG